MALLVAVLVVAAGLLGYALWRHVMWFDELQAWNIARASHSVGALYGNLRYEGHPIGWYLVLYALTRVTGDPRAMQVVEFAIVVGSFALVLFRAPFSVTVRVLIVGGYCLAFEYGIISRGYGLGVLALLLVLVALARPRPAWGLGLAAATLLAWTSLEGAVLTVVLALAVALDPGPRSVPRKRFVLGGLLVATGSALTCLPPSDFHAFTPSLGNFATVGGQGVTRFVDATTGVWRGLVPVPARLGGWNSQLLDRLPAAPWCQALASVALFVLVLAALPRSTGRRVWWLGGLATWVFFLVVVLPDETRYAGVAFLLFLAAVWLAVAPPGVARAEATGTGASRRLPIVVLFVVVAQVVALLAVAPSLTFRPFSPDRAVAGAARAAHVEDAIVSGEDFDATAVGADLDRPSYSVARRAWIRFFVHDDLEARRRAELTTAATVCAAASLAARLHRPAGLITQGSPRGPGVERVLVDQQVGLYRVSPRAAAGCPPGLPVPLPP
ncbi:MAG TPA: hypothetical protein VGU73_00415, partial [Acidimicrobiia bacterium]|nr:hypothetical protein [Acidimicrobiia bacterium]